MHLGDLVGRRRAAGADRPDRLVGDDERRRASRRRGSSRRAGGRRRRGPRRPRARPASRRRRRWRAGRRATPPSALARTSASVSPWSVRRSEWPTITAAGAGVGEHLGRDVAGVGAGGLARGSPGRRPRSRDPPTPRRGERDQRRGRADQQVDVAGEVARAVDDAPSAPRPKRASPFIFQLPATSGRRARKDIGGWLAVEALGARAPYARVLCRPGELFNGSTGDRPSPGTCRVPVARPTPPPPPPPFCRAL